MHRLYALNCNEYFLQVKRKGIFGGPLVIHTLATHYNAIRGAASVPSLEDSESSDRPSVALALSAAAVRRLNPPFCMTNI